MFDYQTVIEEGVSLSPFTQEMTDWLQRCFELLEAGQEDEIYSDPFYVPPFELSDEKVDALIVALDQEYDTELGKYPEYHRNRSGANANTEFHRMGTRARRAMAEGALRIIQKYDTKPSRV